MSGKTKDKIKISCKVKLSCELCHLYKNGRCTINDKLEDIQFLPKKPTPSAGEKGE